MASSWLRLLAILLSTSIALPLEKADKGAMDGRAAMTSGLKVDRGRALNCWR